MVAAGLALPATAAVAAGAVRTVAPTGSGSACSTAAPCDLVTAVRASGPGDVVELRTGSYGEYTLSGAGGTAAAPLTVRAAAGAQPRIVRITSSVPSVVWTGLTITGTFYLNAPAAGSTLTGMRFDGGGLFLRSSRATVTANTFGGGSSIDGIQVGRASDVLIEGNTITGYNQSIANGYHADCLQIFDSSRVTVRGNRLANCYNAGIILSPGDGTGITDVLIESNFIQGCVVRTAACEGGSAVDLRPPKLSGLVVRGNTILDGSTRLIPSPGLVFDRNIVGYLSDCTAPITNTVVLSWNAAMCAQPAALGTNGNRYGTVDFVDRDGGELHLVDPTQARIAGLGGLATAPEDIDGQLADSRLAGADSVPGAVLGPVPAPVPPGGGSGNGSGGGGSSGGAPTVALPAATGAQAAMPGIDGYFAAKGVTSASSFTISIDGKVKVRGIRETSGWSVAWALSGVAPGSYPSAAVVTTASGSTVSLPVVLKVVAAPAAVRATTRR
ncbi:right-handed parallel beta-helix repeat-containing protein [Protaetiibacter larvae]|nr:right-handed parallel beta-helix repeat-containing protein [Protaetiibacter larvae]